MSKKEHKNYFEGDLKKNNNECQKECKCATVDLEVQKNAINYCVRRSLGSYFFTILFEITFINKTSCTITNLNIVDTELGINIPNPSYVGMNANNIRVSTNYKNS